MELRDFLVSCGFQFMAYFNSLQELQFSLTRLKKLNSRKKLKNTIIDKTHLEILWNKLQILKQFSKVRFLLFFYFFFLFPCLTKNFEFVTILYQIQCSPLKCCQTKTKHCFSRKKNFKAANPCNRFRMS